jgi:hypothetical protein
VPAHLRACLPTCDCWRQPLARASIQALKLFYVEQHDEGQLQGSSSSGAAKRQKVSTSSACGHAPHVCDMSAPEVLELVKIAKRANKGVRCMSHLSRGLLG